MRRTRTLDFVVLTVLRVRGPPDQMHLLAAFWASRLITCAETAGRHASYSGSPQRRRDIFAPPNRDLVNYIIFRLIGGPKMSHPRQPHCHFASRTNGMRWIR